MDTLEKPPRIALIIPGGIGTGWNNIGVPVLERLVRILSKTFSITVFSLFEVNPDYHPENFELISISGPNTFFKLIKLAFVFAKCHRQSKFKIVHGFWALPSGFAAVFIGKVFNIKSVVSILGGDSISIPMIDYGQLRKPLNRRLIFWSLNQADEVISLTRYLVMNLKQFGFIREDIHIIPWGIDTDMFFFQAKPRKEIIQFYHIANLNPVKDQETLLRCFKIIGGQIPAHLTIIGEGTDKDKVKQMISMMGMHSEVTVMGQVQYDKLPSYYHQADVLLHTSLSEGQCEVVTEAMSCGVLVCGTAVGLLFDQPECCYAVGVKQYEQLARGTIAILGDKLRMKKIITDAHAWASAHSIDWTANEMANVYFKLIAK